MALHVADEDYTPSITSKYNLLLLESMLNMVIRISYLLLLESMLNMVIRINSLLLLESMLHMVIRISYLLLLESMLNIVRMKLNNRNF